jgi:hypothetical protein
MKLRRFGLEAMTGVSEYLAIPFGRMRFAWVLALAGCAVGMGEAQTPAPISAPVAAQMQFRPFNYDQSKVAPYTLLNPLVMNDGASVISAAMWRRQRRPQILHMFASQMFGETPTQRLPIHYGPVQIDRDALNGTAIREQVTVYFAAHRATPCMHILLYLPAHAAGPVSAFVGLNWSGNQAVATDPGISLHTVWVPDAGNRFQSHPEQAPAATRGQDASEWQLRQILANGYGLATAYDGDIEPDFDGGIRYGVRPLFFRKGQTVPQPDQWGALGAWAWGLSQIVDWLDTNKAINAKQIVLIGHSRLGKAALWAGAQDQRFAMVISSESGKGGASLMKRDYGETVEHMNVRFPYWFCRNFREYSNHANELPVDGNLLLALIAPRPLYVGTATPGFLDPKGSFLAAVSAGAVYSLLGRQGLETDTMPPLDHPIMHTIGYHERPGKHDITAYDWSQYLKFATMHFNTTRQS